MAQRLSQPPPDHRPASPALSQGPPPTRRRTWVEVDLDAIARNLALLRQRLGNGCRVLAVVKADAYGHGAIAVSRRLEAEQVDLLGVAIPEEGRALRESGVRAPILVLGVVDRDQLDGMARDSLIPTVCSLPMLDAILEFQRRAARRPLPFHLKVDTGMGRLGLLPGQVPEALDRIAASGAGPPEGLLTHLSCADDPEDQHTPQQIEIFRSVLSCLRDRGFNPAFVHAASSGAILDHPASWFNLARPGLALYGVHPSEKTTRIDLRPALSFRSRLVLVKTLEAGSPVGYGRSFVTRRRSLIGTVAAGYADGVNRLLSNRGDALVRGRRAPFAGRVSMDHVTLDLTDVPCAAEGDEVTFIGRQDAEEITATEFAAWAETIPYEVLCHIGQRVPRLYMAAGRAAEML